MQNYLEKSRFHFQELGFFHCGLGNLRPFIWCLQNPTSKMLLKRSIGSATTARFFGGLKSPAPPASLWPVIAPRGNRLFGPGPVPTLCRTSAFRSTRPHIAASVQFTRSFASYSSNSLFPAPPPPSFHSPSLLSATHRLNHILIALLSASYFFFFFSFSMLDGFNRQSQGKAKGGEVKEQGSKERG